MWQRFADYNLPYYYCVEILIGLNLFIGTINRALSKVSPILHYVCTLYNLNEDAVHRRKDLISLSSLSLSVIVMSEMQTNVILFCIPGLHAAKIGK